MRFKYVYITLIIGFLCFCSCSHRNVIDRIISQEGTENISSNTKEFIVSPDSITVSRYNKFAYDFLATVMQTADEQNIVVSPLSTEMLLSLLANGADSAALDEILRYLNFGSLVELNEMNAYWLKVSDRVSEYTDFSLANSIWVSDDIKLKKGYKNRLLSNYRASLGILQSNPIQSQKEINQWVADNTDGMISNFLKSPLGRSVKFALYNATYFNGEWWQRFFKRDNRELPFKTASGEVKVTTMRRNLNSINYYSAPNYRAIDINFYDKEFCMRVVVPKDSCSLEQVIRALAVGVVAPQRHPVDLSLPKFNSRCRIDNLKNILKTSGVSLIFNDPKCLTSISSTRGLLNDVELCQESVIDCEEKGIKVAAVSGFEPAFSSGENIKIEYIDFKVDRPFIFSIMDNKSEAVMFTGIVRDPSK